MTVYILKFGVNWVLTEDEFELVFWQALVQVLHEDQL
jgi:hypothetical protein